MKKIIRNGVTVIAGGLIGLYTGQYFPDLYFQSIQKYIPVQKKFKMKIQIQQEKATQQQSSLKTITQLRVDQQKNNNERNQSLK